MLHSSCAYLTSYDGNTRKIARVLCEIDKAVEWAREQKKKILEDKNRRIADALMEKMTPMILKNSAQK